MIIPFITSCTAFIFDISFIFKVWNTSTSICFISLWRYFFPPPGFLKPLSIMPCTCESFFLSCTNSSTHKIVLSAPFKLLPGTNGFPYTSFTKREISFVFLSNTASEQSKEYSAHFLLSAYVIPLFTNHIYRSFSFGFNKNFSYSPVRFFFFNCWYIFIRLGTTISFFCLLWIYSFLPNCFPEPIYSGPFVSNVTLYVLMYCCIRSPP